MHSFDTAEEEEVPNQQKLEEEILQILSLDKKLLLEDQKAIDVLTASKTTSNDIKAKQAIAEKTEVEINEARETYKPLAAKLLETLLGMKTAGLIRFCISVVY